MTLPAYVDSSGVVALFVNGAVVFSDGMLVTAVDDQKHTIRNRKKRKLHKI